MRRIALAICLCLLAHPAFAQPRAYTNVTAGSTLPAACDPARGGIFVDTSSSPAVLNLCTATNTWTPVGSGGGGGTVSSSGLTSDRIAVTSGAQTLTDDPNFRWLTSGGQLQVGDFGGGNCIGGQPCIDIGWTTTSNTFTNFWYLDLRHTPSADQFSMNALTWQVETYGPKTITTNEPFYFKSYSTAPSTNHYGIYFDSDHDDVATNAYGTYSRLWADGTHTNSYNFYANNRTSSGADGTSTNWVAYYSDAIGSAKITNGYSFWSDEQGVYRIRSDNTFNSVYQGIAALYNPQYRKYTAGANAFERGIPGQWESNVYVLTTEKGPTQTLTSLTSISTTATATKTNHNYATGDVVTIAGADQTEYNGAYTITRTGADTFTYPFAGSATSPATGTITAQAGTLRDMQIGDAGVHVLVSDLKTTGAAGSKKVVCVDTSTGRLYASSSDTQCSN